MKTAVVYTVLSLCNFIGFVIGICFMPSEVPIHFDASMTADAVGSPWVYLALPGAAALISVGVWASLVQKKNRAVTVGLLSAFGIILAAMGWAFFALIASGVQIGERTDFPLVLVICLPLSLLFVWLGNYMPRIEPNRMIGIRTHATLSSEEVWRKAHRFGGYLFFAAGIFAAIVALIFGTVPALKAFQYVAVIVLAVSCLAASFACVVYAHILGKKEAPSAEETL